MADDEFPLTMSVPEAGKKYYGLSRNASYDAAARGEIPTIPVGRLLRVPTRLMERMLDTAGDQPRPVKQPLKRARR
jgi:hypothetical protein